MRRLLIYPDSQKLIVTDANQQVAVWSLSTRRELYHFLCNPSQTIGTLSPDGKQLAAGGNDGEVYCVKFPQIMNCTPGLPRIGCSTTPTPQDVAVGIASADNRIRLFNVETGQLFSTIAVHPDSILHQMGISTDGARIATLDENFAFWSDPMFFLHMYETTTQGIRQNYK